MSSVGGSANSKRGLQKTCSQVYTVEPPLTATIFRPGGQKSPYVDSCSKPLYNGHLFTTVTLFCPQGGCFREVQLYRNYSHVFIGYTCNTL